MASINMNLDDFTKAALKRLVQQLVSANESEEKKLLSKIGAKNDLADLDEEMHGKPNTPQVEDDDMPDDDEELPEVPKKKGKTVA
jgi:hypothetical protein